MSDVSGLRTSQVEILAPLAVALPDPPIDQFFTDEQWRTLMAIMDTVIPSIRRESATSQNISELTIKDGEYNAAMQHLKDNVIDAPDSDSLKEYLEEKPSDNAAFQKLLQKSVLYYSTEDARKGLAFVLSTLK
jgi:hypothetical protein